ncbi:MAG: fimbrillin family protein, partial [Bacteroidales bacterium]|nr:fimbrillin family protein [Bacteroidales bacterium]
MKRIQPLFFLAALAFLSLSCNKEAGSGVSVADSGDIRLNAVVSEMATKATTDESGVTTFVAGDKLTLYAWTGAVDPTSSSVKMVVNGMVNTYDGQSWKPDTQMRWRNVRDSHYFVGIYPKRTVTSLVDDDVTLNPAAAAYEQSDLLVARRLEGLSAQNDGITVDLVFDHMMAKFNINLRYRNQFGPNPCPSAVTIQAAQSGKINYLTGVITPGEKSTQALNKVTSAQFTSLVMPQEGIREIVLTLGGKELVYTHTEDITFEAGKVTTLSLLVGKDKILLDDNTVQDWADGGSSESPDDPEHMLELTRPLTMRAMADGTSVTFTNRSNAPVRWITNDGRSGFIPAGSIASVSLDEGQRVWFMGEGGNEPYGDGTSAGSSHIAVNKDCQVYGNVMSLLSPDYSTATTLSEPNSFSYLFSGQVHLKNRPDESILLPATTLTEGCYKNMFNGCSGLGSLTVLGTDTGAAGCTDGWLNGVADNFSLVTAQPTVWPIPVGATIYQVQAEGEPVKVLTTPLPKSNIVYTGTAQPLVTGGTTYVEGVTLEYSTDGSSWSTSVPMATNAGNYTVYTRVRESGKVILTLTASIAKTNPTYTAPTAKSGLTYNGSAQVLINTGTVNGGTFQYKVGS